MRGQAALERPLLTLVSGFGQVYNPIAAEAGRWVLPLRGAKQNGSAPAEKIGSASRMYVATEVSTSPVTSAGAGQRRSAISAEVLLGLHRNRVIAEIG